MDDLEVKLNWSINKGISFLFEHQFQSGEFCCYFSNNDQMQVYEGPVAGWCVTDSVVFPTALIGNSLLFLADEPKVNEILDKIAAFLLAQRKRGSVWNHFTMSHHLYRLCPFDLDDTSCASAFLKARNVPFPSNTDLILKNINNKNLFYTWITLRFKLNTNKSYWRLSLKELTTPIRSFVFWWRMQCNRGDVDGVVNANVLYYLGETANTKFVVDYLLEIIAGRKEAECDKWYRNVLTVYYFISRNYYNGIVDLKPAMQPIIARVLEQLKPGGSIGESVLDTALAACTFLNFNYNGPEMHEAIQFLLNEQSEDGSWVKWGYYYDGPLKRVSWGSEELTTGVCLEALAKYKKMLHEKNPTL